MFHRFLSFATPPKSENDACLSFAGTKPPGGGTARSNAQADADFRLALIMFRIEAVAFSWTLLICFLLRPRVEAGVKGPGCALGLSARFGSLGRDSRLMADFPSLCPFAVCHGGQCTCRPWHSGKRESFCLPGLNILQPIAIDADCGGPPPSPQSVGRGFRK